MTSSPWRLSTSGGLCRPPRTRGAFLRRQLNAACAAYAIPREASGLKNEASSPLSDKGSPSSDTSQMGAQAMEKREICCMRDNQKLYPTRYAKSAWQSDKAYC